MSRLKKRRSQWLDYHGSVNRFGTQGSYRRSPLTSLPASPLSQPDPAHLTSLHLVLTLHLQPHYPITNPLQPTNTYSPFTQTPLTSRPPPRSLPPQITRPSHQSPAPTRFPTRLLVYIDERIQDINLSRSPLHLSPPTDFLKPFLTSSKNVCISFGRCNTCDKHQAPP